MPRMMLRSDLVSKLWENIRQVKWDLLVGNRDYAMITGALRKKSEIGM